MGFDILYPHLNGMFFTLVIYKASLNLLLILVIEHYVCVIKLAAFCGVVVNNVTDVN